MKYRVFHIFGHVAASAALFMAAALPLAAHAAPTAQMLATVSVVCDGRLGSGAYTSTNGYVVTAGHVATNVLTHAVAAHCQVGFIADHSLIPTTYFAATVEHAAFDERINRDFAVLKLGERLRGDGALPSVPMKIDEFANENDVVILRGFPEGSTTLQTTSGSIKGFRKGEVFSDAPITPGYSGGPAVNAAGNMVAISTRVNYKQDADTGIQKVVDYDLGDVLPLITWLDTFGANAHDQYLTHASDAYHAAHLVYRREWPGCNYVVRTASSQGVYCLLNGPYRLVFPNEAVYYSWYPDFSGLKNITAANMAEYQLIGNVSMRAGSLIKIQTDPRVYVVTDSIGTIRWVPTEQLAIALFGANWAKQVRDVPVEFFVNYRIAEQLQ